VLSLEPEIVQLRDDGRIAADVAAPLIAEERRQIVSLYTEVRVLAWLGVMLIVTGVGIVVSKNLDRIGPIAIATAIGLASGSCYVDSVWRRAPSRASIVSDSVLLLGALLLSTDVGYIEHHFHILGREWPRHFLWLAIVHGVTAYSFSSAALLSLSIGALAAWLGIERNMTTLFVTSPETAMRAFACAAVVAVWRVANRRPQFERVFDHFIANLALWGGLILTFDDDTRTIGATVVIVLAALTIAYSFRSRAEAFLIYAYIYAVIAIDVLVIPHGEVAALLYLTLSTTAAIVGLFVLHGRFRKAVA